jgi:type II secretory pathway pseudopilin PulG
MLIYKKQHGDTIIEVMLSFTVFALLAVGAITIMNQGVASAQQALETTLVRQQVSDPSAVAGTSAGKFQEVRGKVVNEALGEKISSFSDESCLSAVPNIGKSFAVNTQTGSLVPNINAINNNNAPAYAQVQGDYSYGIWIEAAEVQEAGQPSFIDFHIRACWYSLTSEAAQKIGTIVRLYVPKS